MSYLPFLGLVASSRMVLADSVAASRRRRLCWVCPASPCAPTRSARLHARSEPTSWSEPIRIASSAKRTPFSTATLAPARFPRSGTVGPANGLWTSSSVNTLAFEHIRRDVEGGRNSRRGELEMGGVLFGIHEPGCIWILASKPLQREYAMGSGFVLAKGRHLISASATRPRVERAAGTWLVSFPSSQ